MKQASGSAPSILHVGDEWILENILAQKLPEV
jgi:hypothetical protein